MDRLVRAEGAPARIVAGAVPHDDELFPPAALQFLADLHRRFDTRRRGLLSQRGAFRDGIRAGRIPGFLAETHEVRETHWRVAPPPIDLVDRRVEITGPPDRKMIINALNSGARVYMADFEDAHAPTWSGTIAGQHHLKDAVRRRIIYRAPDEREYVLHERIATLMVRPRGWHLDERHLTVDGQPISASLFDFGLFLFHNGAELLRRGTGPYYYLPKLEHYLEARLWNDVFLYAEAFLALPNGAIRATVLIETLPAAFQMDEILFELRDHSAGLNCGRWDYLFSFIKQYRDDGRVRFPDRDRLTMDTPFLTAYSSLLVQTCHRRGAHAMGGMAAQIPIAHDPEANREAIARVVADKEREVRAGHDGTWVAHPALVPIATEIFDREMPGPNQIGRAGAGRPIDARDLLTLPHGPITEEGVRRNARVSFLYLESWLRGIGCVPIDHLMEDAATAEIARSELWYWIHHAEPLDGGGAVDGALFRRHLAAEVADLRSTAPRGADASSICRAAEILDRAVTSPELEEFITTVAYAALADPP